MVTLTTKGKATLGEQASEIVEERAYSWGTPQNAYVPDDEHVTGAVLATLTRHLGRPATIDRGEVAYWRLPQDWWTSDD